jgi:hypothetical protein
MDENELQKLRRDVDILRKAIDSALQNGAAGQHPLVRAAAATLQERLQRLERLEETVTISLTSGDLQLGWPARDALLAEAVQVESGGAIRNAFEAAGSLRPVELTLEQKADLLGVLDYWADATDGEYVGYEGIVALRAGLEADLQHRGHRGAE